MRNAGAAQLQRWGFLLRFKPLLQRRFVRPMHFKLPMHFASLELMHRQQSYYIFEPWTVHPLFMLLWTGNNQLRNNLLLQREQLH